MRGGFSGLGLQVVSVAVSPFGICGGGYADEAEFLVEIMRCGSFRSTEELEIEEVSHSSGGNQLSKNRFCKTLSLVLFESDDIPYSGELSKSQGAGTGRERCHGDDFPTLSYSGNPYGNIGKGESDLVFLGDLPFRAQLCEKCLYVSRFFR